MGLPLAELSSLIVALGGSIAAVAGVVLSRRGQRDTRRDQLAAGRLADRKASFEEAETAVRLAREDADRERARADRAEARTTAVQGRCDVAIDQARDSLRAIVTVVLDEATRAAGEEAVEDLIRHQGEHDPAP